MTFVTERLSGTQTGSIDPTGSRTVTRVFDVKTGSDSGTLAAAMLLMDSSVTGVPIGDTVVLGTVWDYDTNAFVSAIATYYGQKSWVHAEGDTGLWTFTLTYSTAPSASGGNDSDGDPLTYVTTQGTTSATTKSVYRIHTTGTNEEKPPDTDIGGFPIDVGGTPTSVVDVDRRFTVTEKMYRFPNVGFFSKVAGTRNLEVYEGGAIGSILYLGFSWALDSSSGFWNITHNFSVDDTTFHAEQVAKTDPQGAVIPSKTIGTHTYESYHASEVYWKQPFLMHTFVGLPRFST